MKIETVNVLGVQCVQITVPVEQFNKLASDNGRQRTLEETRRGGKTLARSVDGEKFRSLSAAEKRELTALLRAEDCFRFLRAAETAAIVNSKHACPLAEASKKAKKTA